MELKDQIGNKKTIIEFMEITPKSFKIPGSNDGFNIRHPSVDKLTQHAQIYSYTSYERCAEEFLIKSRYHVSWDWLMPVIEKINETTKEHGYTNHIIFSMRVCYTDIHEAFLAAVEYIEFYNKLKPL